MAGLKVKKGDNVYVLSGNDKGKTGKVLAVNPKDRTVIVEGIAVATKHKKPRGMKDQGGIVHIEAPISVSKVMVICDSCKKPTKVSMNVTGEGKEKTKIRVCKKCGSEIKTQAYKKEK